jgi:hypothetical protein
MEKWMDAETNRDKALRGEVVRVTDSRLKEMQQQAIKQEGFGPDRYHWHWAALVNEMIALRKAATAGNKRPRMASYPVDAIDRAIMDGRLTDINDLPEGVDPDCFHSSGEVDGGK